MEKQEHEIGKFKVKTVLIICFALIFIHTFDYWEVFNDIKLPISYEYWGDNATFFYNVSVTLNILFYSCLPFYFALVYLKKYRLLVFASAAVPLYWAFFFIREVTNPNNAEEIIWPNAKYYIYTIVAIAGVITIFLWIRSWKITGIQDILERAHLIKSKVQEKVPEIIESTQETAKALERNRNEMNVSENQTNNAEAEIANMDTRRKAEELDDEIKNLED